MFNYKTWKLYYPGMVEPEKNPLSKNLVIPPEEPANDLEKVLSNINGADPAYPVEEASGLIKQMNELAENPPSGGDVFVVNLVGNNAVDKTMGEIQEAWARNDRIELQGSSGGGIYHSIAVYLHEVHLDGRSHTYDGGVSFATGTGIKVYGVTETTEADALNAYPSVSG